MQQHNRGEFVVVFANINITDKKTIVFVQANAGENWHEFVLWTIGQDFGGIENMSLIPGNVGASPMQNIGA